MKSQLDLSSKADQVKIAKFILGAANRMPDDAAQRLDGFAVLVAGVAPGAAAGIPRIENHELRRLIDPFVGVGPRWDVERVSGDGDNQVLIIVVSPPTWGEAPYPCLQTSGSLQDGDIYIRADGETRKANGAEIGQLVQRSSPAKPRPEVTVDLVGPVHAYEVDTSAGNQAIAKARASLLSSLPGKGPAASVVNALGLQGLQASAIMGGLYRTVEESRSESEFQAEVDRWGVACLDARPDIVRKFVKHHVKPIRIDIRNAGQHFLEDVEVQLYIAGDIVGLKSRYGDDYDYGTWLPKPPRKYGPYTRSLIPTMPDYGHLVPMNLAPVRPVNGPTFRFDNGGSISVTVTIPTLRPAASHSINDRMCVIVQDPSLRQLQVSWHATARGHDVVMQGEVSIPVGEPKNVSRAVERVYDSLNQ
ncbi:hypothetical protein SAMN04489867_2559 [Pedococcus dokdonensis]|uniref:Uncharacterized protein n=1 Tax=Pedococcus dokdonensis TaxID=443156 RepID=A0A1H0SYD4_9MICO|nr:hypothetical protein [Pedococcus dokdonensis]SDP46827.1 hypothetical protein SAMN04489867_2559 [Pedococcus dokdonensis]